MDAEFQLKTSNFISMRVCSICDKRLMSEPISFLDLQWTHVEDCLLTSILILINNSSSLIKKQASAKFEYLTLINIGFDDSISQFSPYYLEDTCISNTSKFVIFNSLLVVWKLVKHSISCLIHYLKLASNNSGLRLLLSDQVQPSIQ